MSPTIAIDARAAAEVPAGRGRYVRELLRALAALPEANGHRFELWARARWDDPALDDRFAWRLLGLPDPAWNLAAAVRARGDAFLSTNSYLTAWATRIPTTIVVHDMVAFVAPEFAQQRAARIERATLGVAVRRAAAIICVSDATRADLIRRYPRAAARARTVLHAADAAAPAGALPAALHRPYVLAVGTLEPRKNLAGLIAAWAELPAATRARYLLAIAGPTGWEEQGILAAARARDDVRLLGHVSDAELTALYENAACFALPSHYEGFGLPVLEAMRAGAPVITSDNSSLAEIAGDAALLVDPLDRPALTAALERVLSEPGVADSLRARGRERAREFSWERCARETLAIVRATTIPRI